MKELHREGRATHPGPESCGCYRKVTGEALTGESAGQPLSCEIHNSSVPTLFSEAEGKTEEGAYGESSKGLAQSETLSMHGHSLHGNREILEVPSKSKGRLRKATNYNLNVHASRKSDNCIVPRKQPNKSGVNPMAEDVEGRQLTNGNTLDTATARTQSRNDVLTGIQRVRTVARREKREQFTNLLHHVNVDLLRESFLHLKKKAALGVDGVTWKQYEADLEKNLNALHAKVHQGTYRAQPSRRIYIPKADGKQRPLGNSLSGGQNRSAGRGNGTECSIRDRLHRFFLRVSARKEPSHGIGCLVCRTKKHELFSCCRAFCKRLYNLKFSPK